MNFKGKAKRIEDIDFPLIGREIGVGEDEVHAILDVESAGSGFDKQGRPKMLFEPHIFWRELGPGPKRDAAAKAGLAYPKWKRNYPADSYPRLAQAIAIDENAALRSASWGLGQIMGFNHKMAGFDTAKAMVLAFMDDEDQHLRGMINFIRAAGLDDELRRHDWAGFARGYNGVGFAKNGYDRKLRDAFAKWQRIKDTPVPHVTVSAKIEHEPPLVLTPSSTVTLEPAAPPIPSAQRVEPVPAPAPAPKVNKALAALIVAVGGIGIAFGKWLLGLITDAAAFVGNLFN